MKRCSLILAILCLCFPALSRSQSTGRIECPRMDDYIYLYSSVSTMEVRKTLQCGSVVEITGTFDSYYAARTAKGDTGYVPKSSVVLLKDQMGTGLPETAQSDRERTPYDERVARRSAAAPKPSGFLLPRDTPIRVKLLKGLSSGTAHAGDAVEFDVLDDVTLDGVVVIARGAKATGTVAESEIKKRFGHDGKLAISITSVRLTNTESAPVRFYYETLGSSNSSAPVQLSSGKDALIPPGTDFTVLIDGDVRLKREDFTASKAAAGVPAADNAQSPATASPR